MLQTFVLFALLHVQGPFAREALVCCSFPLPTAVVLFAAKYKAIEVESASMLLLSTLCLVVTVPVTLVFSARNLSAERPTFARSTTVRKP